MMVGTVEEDVMTPQKTKIYDLHLGDMVWTEPHGAACLLGAVDGQTTFIVAIEKEDKVIYTIITQESIVARMDVPQRLTRIKNASFGTDLLAGQK